MTKKDGPEEIEVHVGNRIRSRRRWLGLTQSRLGNAVGVKFQQIQKYECGESRVSALMLVKIAAALETTVAFLVGEDHEVAIGGIIAAHLEIPGAADLLAAFAKIRDGEARCAVLEFAQDMKKAGTRQLTRRRTEIHSSRLSIGSSRRGLHGV